MISTQKVPVISTTPTFDWEPIVAALRDELQEYGALLSLLSSHQESIIKRNSERIVELNEDIENQIKESANLRSKRETVVGIFAMENGLDKQTPIKALYHLFPETAQHLIQALAEEVVSIIKKTQHRARQNQLLINRATQITEELIDTLQNKKVTKTYTRKGSIDKHANTRSSVIRATV